MPRTPESNFDCQECGERVTGQEFHSYESCILYMLRHNPERITDDHRRYVWQAGEEAMKSRVRRKVISDDEATETARREALHA